MIIAMSRRTFVAAIAALCSWPFLPANSAVAQGSSTLSGVVFVDKNIDIEYDPLEDWVLPNVEIRLLREGDASGGVTAITDDNGYYEFSELAAGEYSLVQLAIPDGYLTAMPIVGELFDVDSGLPTATSPGVRVLYDQQNDVLPQIVNIELPETATEGIGYDFAQIWTGKAWYLTGGGPPYQPPEALPPVPEPSTLSLVIAAGLIAATRLRRR